MTKFMVLLVLLILPATVSAQDAATVGAAQGGPVPKCRTCARGPTW